MSAEPDRLESLRSAFGHREIDAFLVSHLANIRYLFGFTGSSALAWVSEQEALLIVDSRYIDQALEETHACQPVLAERSPEAELEGLVAESSARRIGVEGRHISFERMGRLEDLTDARFVSTTDLVETQRMVKSREEISLLEEAFASARSAYREFLDQLKPGQSEKEAAGILEFACRRAGSEGTAFETIVASGPRSALPHARTGDRRISEGEPLLVDFGMRLGGYCTDMTRTLARGNDEFLEIEKIVREAQAAALGAVRPGIAASEIDRTAREVIEKAGHGEHFRHSTGHGLGLEVHELPHVSARGTHTLQEGMVITVEPGIYLPGRFGVRLEDAVVVTSEGFRFLSRQKGENSGSATVS